MRSLLAGVVLALALPAATAQAATVPERFNGMWVDAGAPNKNLCQRAEPKGEDNRPVESMMSIGPEGVTYYEQHCKIVSVKVLPGPNPQGDERNNLEVGLSCKGEGMLWSAREIWHAQTIDGKRLLVVTALTQTNFRDERGRRQNTPSMVTTSIYHACK